MTAKHSSGEDTSDREIVTVRVIRAPRELVFDAWVDPLHIGAWWGPDGFSTTTKQMEVRPGGSWRFIMHGPDGVDYPNLIVYREVVRPERLVFDHGTGEPGDDYQFHNTVTFEESRGETTLTMRAVFKTSEERDRVVRDHHAVEGGQQTLARLAAFVEQRR